MVTYFNIMLIILYKFVPCIDFTMVSMWLRESITRHCLESINWYRIPAAGTITTTLKKTPTYISYAKDTVTNRSCQSSDYKYIQVELAEYVIYHRINDKPILFAQRRMQTPNYISHSYVNNHVWTRFSAQS